MQESGGRDMLEVLALPENERRLVQWLLRRDAAGVSEIAAYAGQGEDAVRPVLDALTGAGFLARAENAGPARWRACLAARPVRRVSTDIWKRIDE
jgi:hypothetical protein